jgi:Ca-activated chloride channel homolog
VIELLWPYALLLAPLPLLARALLQARPDRQAALTVPDLAPFRAAGHGGRRADGHHWPWRLIVLWLIWLALVAAAARPQWTGDPVRLATSGRDVMLAVDLSGSMSTEDMMLGNRMVNRLVVVQQVISDFLDRRHGDRIGLILFGTNAYLQAPLTADLVTVQKLLMEAPVGIAGGRTAIGDAVGLGVKRLRDRPTDHRVLILLTDGANNSGEVSPLKAAELASVADVRIYSIGLGGDAMRVPSVFGMFSSGMVNPSADMDEETLQAMADITGGRYFRARNTEELAEIYAIIDALEPIEQDPETFRPVAVLYHWPLGLAWVMALGLLAADFRTRWA